MLLGYCSVMFTWSYWFMVLLSSSTSLLIFYPLFYQLLREKCWSLQQELWFVSFSFQLSFCLKYSIALLFDEYTFGVVNLGRLTLSLFYHLSLCLLLMGNKKSSDSPLGPLWNHPDGRKKGFHYYHVGRKSRPPTWPLWHHPSRGVDLLAPSGGHSRGNHGNNARESIHHQGLRPGHAQWGQQCTHQTFSVTCLCGSGQYCFWAAFSYFPSDSVGGFPQSVSA